MKRNFSVKIAIFILFLFRNTGFAQAPNLGAADSFVLFTTTGAFTVTGPSNVTGNVGSDAGSFTGFTPGTLTGRIYQIDSTSAKVALAIDSAYAYLDGMTCGTVIGTTLGSNQTLIPGVYCLGGASTLNGNLILDAQGDPNAIFIFKINGALSTGNSSNIVLIDSASQCNIYWQINGAFDLGDSSIFKGTVVANGAISLLGSSGLEGRGLTRQGAISLDSNIAIICSQVLIPMPLTLLFFNAVKNTGNKSVDISWKTVPGSNYSSFNIERSGDGSRYNIIGNQIAAGNTRDMDSYLFNDGFPEGSVNYYRLDLFDTDGTHVYSNVKAVHFPDAIFTAEIYPNPYTGSFDIKIADASQNNTYRFCLYNTMGEKILQKDLCHTLTNIQTLKLISGIYFYHIIYNDETVKSGKLISQ